MLNYHVKIGLVPIRRDCTPRPGIFNWEYAEDRARKTVAYIEEHFTSENVSFVDLKGINDVEVLYNEKDVQPVVDLMRKERADAIFIINSNFGNEEVAAMGTEGLRPQTDLRDAHTAEILDHTGHADEFVQAFGKDRVAYAAVFNIAERNAVALHLAADAEQAALAVGTSRALTM